MEDPEDSVRIVRTAIDQGVNFMDNSWDYNGGQSEIRMDRPRRPDAISRGWAKGLERLQPLPARGAGPRGRLQRASADRQTDTLTGAQLGR